jgi:hypothetical protein
MMKTNAEEHHITGFDPTSFFTLHDYDESGYWTDDELRRTYGLDHESTDGVSEERRKQAMDQVFAIFDPRKLGIIEQADFVRLSDQGHKLPDFGFGPGHHGDMEYEYEIHHYEKYHDDDTTEDQLTHPEDIEHFKKHREAEELQKKVDRLEKMPIVEANIPAKFFRHR